MSAVAKGKLVLIAGGAGVVGRRVAAQLAPLYPDRILLGGRDLARAEHAAAEIGHGTRGRQLDVVDRESIAAALSDVGTIISCIDQPGRLLMRAAIANGARYTDITPHLTSLGRGAAYQAIDAQAKSSGAIVVLGTGIVPGISSVVVRALADLLGGAEKIETALMLDARDISGRASFEYFIKELGMSFMTCVDGVDHPARPMSAPRTVVFPQPIGSRLAYLFPFSDQALYPATMGARTVTTRLALDPPRLGQWLAVAAKFGVTRLLASDIFRTAVSSIRRDHGSSSGAPFALRVDVSCGGRTRHATLVGQTQANAAAAGASLIGRLLIDGAISTPGAWMPEQVVEPNSFLARLEATGLKVVIAPDTDISGAVQNQPTFVTDAA